MSVDVSNPKCPPKAAAAPEADPLAKPAMRLFSFVDQAFFSAGNFVVTIALARFFTEADLAGYGIGMSVAVILQSVQRMTLVVPLALLNESRFAKRASGFVGQQIFLLATMFLIAFSLYAAAWALAASDLVLNSIAAAASSVMVFFSMDFDRALLMRSGRRFVPLMMSTAYFATVCGLAVLAAFHLISFFAFLGGQAVFGALKALLSIALTTRPSFDRTRAVFMHNLKRNLGWASIGTIASTSYVHIPLFVLGFLGNTLATASYVAIRSPVQPLLIVIRSLDIIDKLRFGRMVDYNPRTRRERYYKILKQYFATSALFAVAIAIFARPILHLLFHNKFDGFEPTLILWSLVFVVTCSILPLETVIYKEGQVRKYAHVQLIGGIAAFACAIPLGIAFSSSGAVLACLIGWILTYAITWFWIGRPLLRRNH